MRFALCSKERDIMDNKQLKKLSRRELLEILVEQSKEIDRLQSRLDEANRQLAKREIIIADTGNIARASLQLNDIFTVAQRAADQYLDSIRAIHQQIKEVAGADRLQNELPMEEASVKNEAIPE
ncbi:MAG: DNA repair protein [Oscillospiraceae bacterium]|nr:DNA repair protein [Oscillospiraceae bacterium]